MMNDKHHLLHSKRIWTVYGEARKLRETPSLIPKIPRELHEDIHRETPPVPLLSYYALRGSLQRFEPVGDTLTDIDGLCSAIEHSTRPLHSIERELGDLAIEALRAQRYMLRGELGN